MPSKTSISAHDYQQLTELIRKECGIVFPASKRTMVESRLAKRARALGLDSLGAYCRHLQTPLASLEISRLIDEVTTHKTDFFREPAHFDYLVNRIVPELAASNGAGIRQPLRVWSAASSTGEEPYTIAMVLNDYATNASPVPYRFSIEATDVSMGVIERGRRAVYPAAAVTSFPARFRQTYLLRSKDREQAMVRMTPEIRARVRFRTLNLMDSSYGFVEPLDVVFCRNVMIYFDRSTQYQIVSKIIATLQPRGYLVMGHSESLNGLDLPIHQVAPTVYRRLDG